MTPHITRYKGLGEMPADQLKQTTMDEKKRLLIQIKFSPYEDRCCVLSA